MPESSSQPMPVPEAFAMLEHGLREAPIERVRRIGGEIGFIVKHAPPKPQEEWVVRIRLGMAEISPGTAVDPIASIGIEPYALTWLVEGSLDVERALRDKRMIILGNTEALARFAECFSDGHSLLSLRVALSRH